MRLTWIAADHKTTAHDGEAAGGVQSAPSGNSSLFFKIIRGKAQELLVPCPMSFLEVTPGFEPGNQGFADQTEPL